MFTARWRLCCTPFAKGSFPDALAVISAKLGLADRVRLTFDLFFREIEAHERSLDDRDPSFQFRPNDGCRPGSFQTDCASPCRGTNDDFELRPESAAGRH